MKDGLISIAIPAIGCALVALATYSALKESWVAAGLYIGALLVALVVSEFLALGQSADHELPGEGSYENYRDGDLSSDQWKVEADRSIYVETDQQGLEENSRFN